VDRSGTHLLGVRHHGPGSARSVRRALADLHPDVVLVELPSDVEPALRWVGHPDLVPPVALLGYVPDQPQRAVFLPFSRSSPEWQALSWAHEHGVPVRAIDEPFAVSLGASDTGDRSEQLPGVTASRPLDPLRELARAAGEDDPERWWDDVVEHRGDGPPAFAAIAEAMAAVRTGWEPDAREARREAAMRQHLRRARTDGFGCIAVVCGAWHVPALAEPLPPAAADARLLRGVSKVKVGVTWAPWTSRRLVSSSGYGAGVVSPAWYDHVFDHPGRDGVARWFVAAGHVLRSRGLPASPDHLIAGTRLADALAALRSRPRPGLAEVLDAATAVLGEGGAVAMSLVRDELVVGRAIGRVPDDAPVVPLARDVAAQQRRLRLPVTATPKEVELDLRTPAGLGRSHLLHRLHALGLGWGVQVDGRGSSGTFRETWNVCWEPEMSVRLIELAAHGTTVAAAATARLVERAVSADTLAGLVRVLDEALLADLPDALGPALDELARRSARDHDTGQLMDVLPPLARAIRYGDVRSTDVAALRHVFDGLVVRVLAGAAGAAVGLDDEASASFVERVSGVQAALALVDHPARHREWPAVLERLAARGAWVHGLVQGRATRLLHDGGDWDGARVAQRLGQALGSGTEVASGAAFVEGFLAGAGTVLIHDTELLGVLDDWLAGLQAASFLASVPLLRRTFGAFEPAERRQIAELVHSGPSGWHGGVLSGDFDTARVERALATVRALLGVGA
jgi:hypothetical protein